MRDLELDSRCVCCPFNKADEGESLIEGTQC